MRWTIWSRRGVMQGLATAAVAGRTHAQPDVPGSPPPAPGGPLPATGKPDANIVFLETAFDQAKRVTVPVYLDGDGPFAFVVDTGSNRTVVAAEIAGRLNLPKAGMAEVNGILSVEPAPLCEIRRIRVGDVLSAGLKAPVVPASRIGADGILGIDMLKDRRIALSFRTQTFWIEPSGGIIYGRDRGSRLRSPEAPITVPARYRSGQLLIIDASAVGSPVTAFLDSGSQVTVANGALKSAALAAQPGLADRLIHSELMSATGQRAPADFGPLPNLTIGGRSLGSPLVAFSDLHIFKLWGLTGEPAVLIGVDVLRRFDQVEFDFARKLITFWPARPEAEPSPKR